MPMQAPPRHVISGSSRGTSSGIRAKAVSQAAFTRKILNGSLFGQQAVGNLF